MRDLITIFKDFKTTKVGACITKNEDGTHTIFINSRLSKEQQAKAVKHELNHFYRDDFSKIDINDIEKNM